MNELELMKHARGYIDQLARGIDPISGRAVPEDTVLNQPRLSRCFAYVSEVLGQVIDNGGRISAGQGDGVKKLPFQLTAEQRAQFAYCEEPLSVTHIARRINDLIDRETMKRFPYTWILNWLLAKELLTVVELDGGKTAKMPTELGKRLGLCVEHRKDGVKEYDIVLYNQDAQHFIIDNLDDMIQE